MKQFLNQKRYASLAIGIVLVLIDITDARRTDNEPRSNSSLERRVSEGGSISDSSK